MTLDLSNKKLSSKEQLKVLGIYKDARVIGRSGAVFDRYAKSVKAMKPLHRDAWVKGYLEGYDAYHETKHPNKYQQGDTKHDSKA